MCLVQYVIQINEVLDLDHFFYINILYTLIIIFPYKHNYI